MTEVPNILTNLVNQLSNFELEWIMRVLKIIISPGVATVNINVLGSDVGLSTGR